VDAVCVVGDFRREHVGVVFVFVREPLFFIVEVDADDTEPEQDIDNGVDFFRSAERRSIQIRGSAGNFYCKVTASKTVTGIQESNTVRAI
jgi:hypothetical protein